MEAVTPPNKEELRFGEDFGGLCGAIGYICQNWAMLEQVLDMCIAMIYHDIGGRAEINPEIPRSFKMKVRFLKHAFSRLEPIKKYKEEATEILREAKILSKARNDLVHGAITSLTPNKDGGWPMVIFDFEIDEASVHWHHSREFVFSPARFQELESKLTPLANRAGKFGHLLMRELRLKQAAQQPLDAKPRSAPNAKETG